MRVGTLFCHGSGDEFLVAPYRDGDRLFRAKLELKATDAGPRPGRFRVLNGAQEDLRDPMEFVDIARRADRIRISEQTSPRDRERIRECLEGYQLEATTVRTCRHCSQAGLYSPITEETAISHGDDTICRSCAKQELERELRHQGSMTGAARQRLEELLWKVKDLDRITDLLKGRLDPDLTKVDEMDATVQAVDPVPVADLDVHPDLQAYLDGKYDELLPVQSRAVHAGLLDGEDQLVVSATATGKTLVGELAGIDRVLRGEGKLLFLVPLVALANQTYEDFQEAYGDLVDVTLRVGGSRVRDSGQAFDPNADVIVGTYEGIDHSLRVGKDLGDVGTVVIDEVHTIAEEGRGHRLDGLISRLKYYCEERAANRTTGSGGASADSPEAADPSAGTQWIYLSATVGNPGELAAGLDASLVEFEERPVPIERHLTFADGREKPDVANTLVKREYDHESSKGYHGQTIIFTNSRRRCHEIARKLDYSAAAYHAGLDYGERKSVERRFLNQDLAAVVTTAALAAGVDFPASQVVFDSLAMGIEWLTVQEFEQMLGRAGRPDYHDRGRVYVLVEPDCAYHNSQERTEDEVAFQLLKGEMEPVRTRYDGAAGVEETLANVVVGGAAAKRLNDRMVGQIPTTHALGKCLEYEFIDGLEPTDLGRAVTSHFLAPDDAFRILEGIRHDEDPYEIVARVILADEG
ncbi:rad24a/uvrB domain-containing protein [Salinarchaeum sp. Harcht-Bsk1]|nr:rad24a/uvrB domain-containing protein [Salinarchaeum sp. Harcht-Bsk1]